MTGISENVVLTYSHPHVATFLTDNTIYSEENDTVVALPEFNGIQVGFFGGGHDNTVMYCSSSDMFLNEFKEPNFKLYGQPAYNAIAALDTNQCGMYILRLLPKNASYANLTAMVDYRLASLTAKDETGADVETDKHILQLRFRKASSGGATTVGILKNKVAEMYADMMDDDGDGWKTAPLFTFWQLGRGQYGNETRLRFTDPMSYTRTDDLYRTYTLTVMEPTNQGLVEKEFLHGVMKDGLLDPDNATNPSLFFEDVVNDPEYGSGKINMLVHIDTLEDILNTFNKLVRDEYADVSEEMTIDKFDPIFGLLMNGESNDLIQIVNNSDAEDYINLVSVSGFCLENGEDGDLNCTFHTDDVESEKTNLLIAAFKGEIDRKLTSVYSVPADFCLDANFPNPVKRAMAEFAANREYSSMTYIDTGLLTTVPELISWGNDFRDITGFNLVKEPCCYHYRDSQFTGKIIPLTTTHFVAKALPKHIAIKSYKEPFARDNAILERGKDFVSGTFLPAITGDMKDEKEQLVRYGMNYYESVNYTKIQRATGITACPTTTSDRQLEFNEYILHKVVQLAYSIMDSKLYKLGEPDDRLRYQTQAEKEIMFRFGDFLRSITVEFVMTAKDERKNVMRLRLAMVFKTVVTRGVVEVYLNPRVSSDTNTATSNAAVAV